MWIQLRSPKCFCVYAVCIWVGNGAESLPFYTCKNVCIYQKLKKNKIIIQKPLWWYGLSSIRIEWRLLLFETWNAMVRFKCCENILEIWCYWVACVRIKPVSILQACRIHRHHPNIDRHIEKINKQSIIYLIRIMLFRTILGSFTFSFTFDLSFDSIKSK